MGFVVIPLITSLIFFYVPTQCSRSLYSFTNWTGLTYNYKFVTTVNFNLFMDQNSMNAIGFYCNHITIAMAVSEIALGIFIARVLNSKIKGQTFFRVVLLPVLSGLTVALIFKQVFSYSLRLGMPFANVEFLQTSLRD